MPVDLTIPNTPPRRGPGRPRKTETQTPPVSSREDALNGLFGMGAAGLLMWRQVEDAQAVSEHGPAVSKQIAVLAETSPQIAKIIDYISNMGPWAALLTACMPLTLQILVNHDRIPAQAVAQFGVVPKESLRAKAVAEMAELQAQVMKEAQDAERRLYAIRNELDSTDEAANE